MKRSQFIITGASRGIGEQLSLMLLENGFPVTGIARGQSERLMQQPGYTHIHYDLADHDGLDALIQSQIHTVQDDIELVCLINNASMLEPLKAIERCSAKEIEHHFQVSLVTPIILTSAFIRHTEKLNIKRKVINLTSGSGTYPAPHMSVYCTAKAGINMFTQCVGAEQQFTENSVEIIAVDPGMVDTDMQRQARSQDREAFEMGPAFQQAYETGQLLAKEEIGWHLLRLIGVSFETGKLVMYSDG